MNLLISLGAGMIGAALGSGSMEKYQELSKPFLAPPGWVFPVVWTILYLLMGIAAYLVSVSEDPDKRQALILYGAQLLVNMLWPLFFFRLDAYLLAFVWLLLLIDLVVLTAKSFSNIDGTAGKLFLPYLIWLVFAAYLNLAYLLQGLWRR